MRTTRRKTHKKGDRQRRENIIYNGPDNGSFRDRNSLDNGVDKEASGGRYDGICAQIGGSQS